MCHIAGDGISLNLRMLPQLSTLVQQADGAVESEGCNRHCCVEAAHFSSKLSWLHTRGDDQQRFCTFILGCVALWWLAPGRQQWAWASPVPWQASGQTYACAFMHDTTQAPQQRHQQRDPSAGEVGGRRALACSIPSKLSRRGTQSP